MAELHVISGDDDFARKERARQRVSALLGGPIDDNPALEIVAGVMRAPVNQRIRIVDFEVKSHFHAAPKAKVVLEVDGRRIETSAAGDGGYDAFVKALKKGLKGFGLSMFKLLDYEVRIPPGGRTDALVEATITWAIGDGRTMVTTGVDSDQLVAAVMATEKILNHVADTELPVPAPDRRD